MKTYQTLEGRTDMLYRNVDNKLPTYVPPDSGKAMALTSRGGNLKSNVTTSSLDLRFSRVSVPISPSGMSIGRHTRMFRRKLLTPGA